MKPATESAYRLLHDGSIALARVEANGIRIDARYLDHAIRKTTSKIARLKSELESDRTWKTWKREFGSKAKLGNRQQLNHVIFDILGHKRKFVADDDRDKGNEAAFEFVDLPFVRNYFRMSKLAKAKTTYLEGIRRELVDGFLHPVYNLNTVWTYRGSADTPNFQNLPTRNEEIARLIRTAFIPRRGNRIVEIDYSGIEVRIAACYHRDPRMIAYIEDPTTDMHRDMAAECYKLKIADVSKDARYSAKNRFVFPQFYGDYYVNCANALWNCIRQMNLEVASTGKSLIDHLRAHGIKKLGACDSDSPPKPGTFEAHIQAVEKDFWTNRFRVYSRWKRDWFEAYQQTGSFRTKTGFVIQGAYNRNQVINAPIQGSAFHCLLWSLIELQREMESRRMRAVIIGQIHDSIIADVPPDELESFVSLARKITIDRLKSHWKWIIVPIDIEVKVSDPDASWYEQKVYHG